MLEEGDRGESQQGKFHLSAERGRVKMSTEFCMWPRTANLWLRFYLGPFPSVNRNTALEHHPSGREVLPLSSELSAGIWAARSSCAEPLDADSSGRSRAGLLQAGLGLNGQGRGGESLAGSPQQH